MLFTAHLDIIVQLLYHKTTQFGDQFIGHYSFARFSFLIWDLSFVRCSTEDSSALFIKYRFYLGNNGSFGALLWESSTLSGNAPITHLQHANTALYVGLLLRSHIERDGRSAITKGAELGTIILEKRLAVNGTYRSGLRTTTKT